MPNATNSTQRFSDRVDNYVRYRPNYPAEVIGILERDAGMNREHVIADIGSGTGISAKLFLDHGNAVYGVEPNQPMRSAAEKSFAGNSRFHSIEGTAESTTLADRSVDFVVAGQAFHWFDRTQARIEFMRVLRPGGFVVLMWNTRRTASTPFLRDYEKLICDLAVDYGQVDHRNIDDAKIQAFFTPSQYRYRQLEHSQKLDCNGLTGRLASSSYMPSENDPRYAAIVEAVKRLFDRHARSGLVEIEYDTELYFGQLEP
jgi:SAM-dependent methyltransferase